jgi:hypothetical protein
MGYQDWQASDRDTKNAIAAATAAKSAADTAIAAATAATANAPINQMQAAKQQALVDAANAAVEKYNSAATQAAEFSKLSTDWFGLGQGFLAESGLDKKIYNPVTGLSGGSVAAIQRTVVGRTPVKDAKGNIIGYTITYSDGSSEFQKADTPTTTTTNAEQQARQSAYDLLYSQFQQYGLESLVTPLKDLVITGASPAEFTIKLRESEAYKKRFAANAQRVAKGLVALDEATYIAKEDAYQNLMRNYGLPESYWKKDSMGTQEGFQTLLANDVSAVELENRLQLAKDRVINAAPEVAIALKNFYPDITNGDILAYTLDPTNSLDRIKSKVAAAEIGGSAVRFGLTTNESDADYLARDGVTRTQAEQGYGTISQILPRSSQLAEFYGESPYTQSTAEQEVFNLPGSAAAKQRRQQLIAIEKAAFSGDAGLSSGALSRDRALGAGSI